MTAPLFPEYVDMPFDFPWPTLCAMACYAMIHKMDIDALIEAAIIDYLKPHSPTP